MKLPVSIIMSILILIILQFIDAQTIPYNHEFILGNTDIQFSGLPEGGLLSIWAGKDDDGAGIFGQFYTNEFSQTGNIFLINSFTANDQLNPFYDIWDDGRFVVCWLSYLQYSDNFSIVARVFDQKGNPSGDEIIIERDYSNDLLYGIQILSDSTFVVNWENYARIMHSNGDTVTSRFLISETTYDPLNIVSLKNGNFFAYWTEMAGIMMSIGCIFDQTGKKIKEDFNLKGKDQGSIYPSAAAITDSTFAVTLYNNSLTYKIFYNNGDLKQGEKYIYTKNRDEQTLSSITGLKNGNFLISWCPLLWDDYTGEYHLLMAQLIDSTGKKKGAIFQINENAFSKWQKPRTTTYAGDKVLISWLEKYQTKAKFFLQSPLKHDLKVFSLLSPLYGRNVRNEDITFKWTTATNTRLNFPFEIEYLFLLGNEENFIDPLFNQTVYDTSLIIPFLPKNKSYYWKILAKNSAADSLWCTDSAGRFNTLSRVQTAIDQASPGQVVVLEPGDYYESISIKKPLTLKAHEGDTVRIFANDYQNPALFVETDSVAIINIDFFGKKTGTANQNGKNAIQIENSAGITLRNCHITGGEGEVTEQDTPGAAGNALTIVNSESIKIINCYVSGGSGKVNEGSPEPHANIANGGNGLVIKESRSLKIDSSLILGGNGSNSQIGSSRGGFGIYSENVFDMDITSTHVKSGRVGSNSFSNPMGVIIGRARPALFVSASENINIENSEFISSGGSSNGFGIHAENINTLFSIVASGLHGAGDYGHGFYCKETSVTIIKSDIFGGPGIGKDPLPGDGIHALSHSLVEIDTTGSTIDGPSWGKDFFYDNTSVIKFFIADITDTAAIIDTVNAAEKYKLFQNYPNPFNHATIIEFDVVKHSIVVLKIFDIQGKQVAVLKNEEMYAGRQQVSFTAPALASGVYFYQLNIGKYRATRKMVLMR